jgi:hypothetical protein
LDQVTRELELTLLSPLTAFSLLNIDALSSSYMDDSEVNYDAYDLSEFTAADFAHIDGTTREHDPAHSNATSDRGAWRRVEETSGSGGPQIAVALECGANEPVVVKVASAGGSESCQGDAVGSVQIVDDSDKGKSDRLFKAANSRSPHEVYRPGGYLSVSDLVGPAWYVQVPSPPSS